MPRSQWKVRGGGLRCCALFCWRASSRYLSASWSLASKSQNCGCPTVRRIRFSVDRNDDAVQRSILCPFRRCVTRALRWRLPAWRDSTMLVVRGRRRRPLGNSSGLTGQVVSHLGLPKSLLPHRHRSESTPLRGPAQTVYHQACTCRREQDALVHYSGFSMPFIREGTCYD